MRNANSANGNRALHVERQHVSQPTVDDPVVIEFVEEYQVSLEAGERPDRAPLLERFPEIADELNACLDGLEFVHHIGVQLDESEGGSQPTSKKAAKLPAPLGDFRIVREIAHGGMGVVYEAQQLSLARRVALKVLPFAATLDPRHLQRFKNEAQAAANLDHPNIVQVHSFGCERGVYYFAMQYIDGQSLTEVIDQLRQPSGDSAAADKATDRPSPSRETEPKALTAFSSEHSTESQSFFRSAARLGIQAAEALEYAHEMGVVHRDIKPSNLLVDASGHLWIADFGLAMVETDANLTMTGDLLGTLRYMSPEQISGKRAVLDQRTDIYSLGLTLYELFAQQPAFSGGDRQAILRMVLQEDPRRPTELNRAIPADLETIVLKAVSKEANERYATAQELADDLGRFLDDKPILARPPTIRKRLAKWSRRHVGVVWTLVLAFLTLAIGLAVSTAAITASRNSAERERETAEEQRSQAEQERQVAIEQQNVARRNQYSAEMVAGQAHVDSGNPGGLYFDLIDYLPLPEEEDIRGWEWYYLMSKCRPEVRTIINPYAHNFAAWSPDGKFIGIPGAIWEAKTGKCIRRFNTSHILRYDVAWSPDGQKFAWAMAADESAFYIWDRSTDSVSRFAGKASCLAWSPDGSRIAIYMGGHTIKIWDVASKTVQWSASTGGSLDSLAWSSDGKLLAAAWGGGIEVWDVLRHELVTGRAGPGGASGSVSWHPQSNVLAVCNDESWYLLKRDDWSVKHQEKLSRGGKIAYSPDGRQIAVTHGESVTVWDSSGETKLAELNGHRRPVKSVSWSPDGRGLVTGDESPEIKLWDLDRLEPATLATETDIGSITWLDNNETLSVVDKKDHSTALWGVREGVQKQRESIAVEDPIAVSPDRKLAAVYNEDKHSIAIRNASNGANRSMIKVDPERHFHSITFSRDGSKVAVQSEADYVLHLEVWKVDQEQLFWSWESKRLNSRGPLSRLIWNADGSCFAAVGVGDLGENGFSAGQDHLHIFDVNQGTRVVKHSPAWGRVSITAVAWSSGGRFVALGTANGHLEVIDVASHDRRFSEKIHRDGITALAWHPMDNRLAVATHDGEVKITSSEEGKVLVYFAPFQDSVVTLAWSNDGQRLAAATSGGEIQTWDAGPAYELSSGNSRRGELAWAYQDRAGRSSGEKKQGTVRAFLRHAPDTLGFWEARGGAFAQLGEFDRAFEEFSKGIEPDVQYAFFAVRARAYALLGAGHLEPYQEACARLVDEFEGSPVPSNRGIVAWLCALAPNPHVDSGRVLDMSQSCLDANGSDTGDQWRLTVGACLYRDRQYDETVRMLTDLTAKLDSSGDLANRYEIACAKYFLALARFHMGHAFQARRLLDEANRMAEQYPQRRSDRYWMRPLEFDTLRREATAAIGK